MEPENSHHDRCIDYLEFNVADTTRSKDFYGEVFGWTFTDPDGYELAVWTET